MDYFEGRGKKKRSVAKWAKRLLYVSKPDYGEGNNTNDEKTRN